jgi:hypothetical protein
MRLTEPVGTPTELAAFDESVLGPFVRHQFIDQAPTGSVAATHNGNKADADHATAPPDDDASASNAIKNDAAESNETSSSEGAFDESATVASVAGGLAALASARAAYMEGSMSASEFMHALEEDLLLPGSLTEGLSDGKPCLAMLAMLHSLVLLISTFPFVIFVLPYFA